MLRLLVGPPATSRASRVGGLLLLLLGTPMAFTPLMLLSRTSSGPMLLSILDSEVEVAVPLALLIVPLAIGSMISGWLATIDRPGVLGLLVAATWAAVGVVVVLSGSGPGLALTGTLIFALLWRGRPQAEFIS